MILTIPQTKNSRVRLLSYYLQNSKNNKKVNKKNR